MESEFNVTNHSIKDGYIFVEYTMPFILATWNDKKQNILRICGDVNGNFSISGSNLDKFKEIDIDCLTISEIKKFLL